MTADALATDLTHLAERDALILQRRLCVACLQNDDHISDWWCRACRSNPVPPREFAAVRVVEGAVASLRLSDLLEGGR